MNWKKRQTYVTRTIQDITEIQTQRLFSFFNLQFSYLLFFQRWTIKMLILNQRQHILLQTIYFWKILLSLKIKTGVFQVNNLHLKLSVTTIYGPQFMEETKIHHQMCTAATRYYFPPRKHQSYNPIIISVVMLLHTSFLLTPWIPHKQS